MQESSPALAIIRQLQLEPHIEGGYFRRSYESSQQTSLPGAAGGNRPCCSSIYYMLTRYSPIGYLHRNRSDIMHYHHSGSSLRYYLVSPEGQLSIQVLGNRLEKGEKPQLLVKGSYWKATELVDGDYGLLSEVVTPGFDYRDMQLAGKADLADCQQHIEKLDKFIRKTDE